MFVVLTVLGWHVVLVLRCTSKTLYCACFSLAYAVRGHGEQHTLQERMNFCLLSAYAYSGDWDAYLHEDCVMISHQQC